MKSLTKIRSFTNFVNVVLLGSFPSLHNSQNKNKKKEDIRRSIHFYVLPGSMQQQINRWYLGYLAKLAKVFHIEL